MLEKIRITERTNGVIQVSLINRAGQLVYTHTDKNMVCTGIQQSMAHLIAGDSVAARMISQIAVGTDGTVRSNEITEFAETDEENKFMRELGPGAASFPEDNQVMFTTRLTYDEPPDPMEVREYGLFSGDGILIARAIKPAINKNSEVSMLINWVLTFT